MLHTCVHLSEAFTKSHSSSYFFYIFFTFSTSQDPKCFILLVNINELMSIVWAKRSIWWTPANFFCIKSGLSRHRWWAHLDCDAPPTPLLCFKCKKNRFKSDRESFNQLLIFPCFQLWVWEKLGRIWIWEYFCCSCKVSADADQALSTSDSANLMTWVDIVFLCSKDKYNWSINGPDNRHAKCQVLGQVLFDL